MNDLDVKQLQETLEEAIDKATLTTVLETLDAICYDKAAHILETYGDDTTMRNWRSWSQRFEKMADDARNGGL